MRLRIALAILFFSAPISAAGDSMLPGDPAQGRKIHEKLCTACHGTDVYQRKDRRVRSVEGLMGQVQVCEGNLNLNLSKSQRADLVKFLNDTYYKFK